MFNRSVRHEPPLPPENPIFHPIIAHMARVTDRHGPGTALEFCRARVAQYSTLLQSMESEDPAAIDPVETDGFTTLDLRELLIWLDRRAVELRGTLS